MTDREAMQQALEALSPWSGEDANHTEQYAAYHALRESLEQPEQEPVAWRNAALRVGEDLCSVGPFSYYDMTAKQWLDWALSVVTVHAPPASKPWVGLTDEEIEAEFGFIDELLRDCCDRTEAKLREKNHG